MICEAATTDVPPPPCVPGWPILGSAIAAATDPLSFFRESQAQYGPIFRFRALGQSIVVMAGVEANAFVARNASTHLRSRDFFKDFGRVYGATKHLPGTDGEVHSQLRRLLGPGISRGVGVANAELLFELTKAYIQRFQPGDPPIDVVDLARRLVSIELGTVLVGINAEEYFDDLVYVLDVMLKVTVAKRSPAFRMRLPRYLRAKRRVDELSKRVLDSHRDPPSSDRPKDVIDAVVEGERSGFLSPNDATMLSLMPYQAGLDTVSHTLAYAIYQLLEHPEVVARVREEVDREVDAHGGFNKEALRAMPVLRGVVMETLRLHPVAFALMRHANCDFEFEGFRVEEGQQVAASTAVTHFDEKLFRDPFRFDVDRFAAPRLEHRTRFAYAPYGLGPSTCLGAGLADAQLAASIASLLRHADIEYTDPTYRLRTVYTPSARPDGLRVRVKAL
jgi:cytochrome P450